MGVYSLDPHEGNDVNTVRGGMYLVRGKLVNAFGHPIVDPDVDTAGSEVDVRSELGGELVLETGVPPTETETLQPLADDKAVAAETDENLNQPKAVPAAPAVAVPGGPKTLKVEGPVTKRG